MTTVQFFPPGKKLHPLARKVDFLTRGYFLSHGRNPGGSGSWIFCPADRFHTINYLDHCVQISGNQPYLAAKRVAADHFAAAGISTVIVCP